MKNKIAVVLLLVFFMFILSGCAVVQKMRRADELELEVAHLRYTLEQLKREKAKEKDQIQEEKNKELSQLQQAKEELELSLQKEIGDYKAKLEMTSKGLVVTFLSEVLFDSGKDKIRQDGEPALKKVAKVLNNNVPDSFVAIEGHTDNIPIKYSGWKSNWELSCARALAVLHYLIDECNVKPMRLSSNGYGEYHPVADNNAVHNRQKNRRVEIVILPAQINKIKAE